MAQTTTTTTYVFDAINTISTFPIYLTLKADSLIERSSYTFTLNGVASSDSTKASSASMTISVNARPSPGSFSISPACDNIYYGSCGIPFETLFEFSASNWVDEHIPISYVFYYLDPTRNAITALSSRSEKSIFSSLLSAGPSSEDYIVMWRQGIWFPNAFSVKTTGARVSMTTMSISPPLMQLNDSLASGDVDVMRGTISMVASTLNSANCDGYDSAVCAKTYNRHGYRGVN